MQRGNKATGGRGHADQTFPGADATDVSIDGVVVLAGEGWDSDAATVEVRLGDVVVAGELTMVTTSRHVWRSSAPLEPDTAYTAHITRRRSSTPTSRGNSTSSS